MARGRGVLLGEKRRGPRSGSKSFTLTTIPVIRKEAAEGNSGGRMRSTRPANEKGKKRQTGRVERSGLSEEAMTRIQIAFYTTARSSMPMQTLQTKEVTSSL